MRSQHSLGPTFGSLLTASFITNIGDGMRLAAMPLLATRLTSSPLYIAALTAAQYLPWILWAPFGGVIVDRSDRRRLILRTQAWRALLMLGLGIAVLIDAAAMWQLIVIAFLITAGEILVDPSVVAMVPRLVTPNDLDRANGQINSVEMATNQFFGQTAGAMIYGFAPWLPFIIDAGTYGGSMLPFARLPSEDAKARRGPSPKSSGRDELAAGANWILRHPFLRPLTGSTAVFHLGTGGTLATFVLLITDVLAQPPWLFGVVLALAGLGAAVASPLAVGLVTRSSRRTVLTVAAGGIALTTLGAATATAAWQVIAIWVVNGASFGLLHSVGRGFVQRHTPNDLIGRTAIASRMVGRGAFVVGALLVGVVAEATSIRAGLVAAAILHAIGGGLIWRSFAHEPAA